MNAKVSKYCLVCCGCIRLLHRRVNSVKSYVKDVLCVHGTSACYSQPCPRSFWYGQITFFNNLSNAPSSVTSRYHTVSHDKVTAGHLQSSWCCWPVASPQLLSILSGMKHLSHEWVILPASLCSNRRLGASKGTGYFRIGS